MAATDIFDIKAYKEMLKSKGVTDEDLAPFNTGQLTTTSEFGRYQSEHKAKQAQLDAERQQVQAKYAELQQYEAWVQQLEAQYGPRENWSTAFQAQVANQNPSPAVDVNVIRQQLQSEWDRREQALRDEFRGQLELTGQGAAAFSKFYYNANKLWEREYGSELPEAEFQKFYTDNGHTNPQVALALFEAPYKEKKQEETWNKKLEEARLEGIRTGISQAGTPGDMGASAGGWFGNTSLANASISAGLAADAANTTTNQLTEAQQRERFMANMDKRNAAGEFNKIN